MDDIGEWLTESLVGRLVLLGALVLLLRLPIVRISGLIEQRQQNREEAVADVEQSWGGPHTVMGPVLVVPYHESVLKRGEATLRPRSVAIEGTQSSIVRRRGIHDVLLYQAELQIVASFSRPNPSDIGVTSDHIYWDEVTLSISGLPHLGNRLPETISIEGRNVPIEVDASMSGVTARLPAAIVESWPDTLDVAYDVGIDGSEQLAFWVSEGQTVIDIESSWPHPKFFGAFLPTTHEIGGEGFNAQWRVSRPGRPHLENWITPDSKERGDQMRLSPPVVGVELVQPVDAYRMARRAIKYEVLFTSLTLGVFFLMEIVGRLRIHPVQYLLVGSALVLFYLLVLSLSEHFAFGLAYALAASGVLGLVYGYARSVLHDEARAVGVGGAMVVLYGFLYVLLALQDFSLLMGSIGLFVVLAGTMFLTRDVDWYGLPRTAPPKVQARGRPAHERST